MIIDFFSKGTCADRSLIRLIHSLSFVRVGIDNFLSLCMILLEKPLNYYLLILIATGSNIDWSNFSRLSDAISKISPFNVKLK